MILLTLLFVLLGGASLVVQDLIVMPSFARLEEANAQTAMKRVRYAMDRSLEYLQINTMDWANWGDAYQFVQDHNANFIKTNVTIPALKQLQVNTILIIDLDGRVVMGTGDVLHTALTLQGSIV